MHQKTRIRMYHNRLKLEMKKDWNGNSLEEMEMEEGIEVMEMQGIGSRERKGQRSRRRRECMELNGKRIGTGRIVRRRARRRIGRVEHFRLFAQNGSIVRARRTVLVGHKTIVAPTEKAKFDKSLSEVVHCGENLDLT